MSGPKHTQAQIETLRVQVEQLRIEGSVQRKKVSEVSRELIDYCEGQKASDVLVSGISDSQNPFQEKKSCVIL